jgi:hypothetical protein
MVGDPAPQHYRDELAKDAAEYRKKQGVAEEQLDEKCWDTHKQVGMKKKGGKMVPNCVPKESVEELDENLRKWFKEKWVRFGPDGKIRGDCARGDDSEGKPKCLPQAKAHALGKKGRKYAASKKRREDPNPERSGKAINVATKKKTNESAVEGIENMKILDIQESNLGTMNEAANLAQQAAIAISMKKKGQKPKNENAEYDDEAGMAENNLETLGRAVEGIDELIQSGDNLPEWCQEKIAIAKSMLVAVWDYMYSEESSDEVDSEVDAMFEAMDIFVEETALKNNVSVDTVWESFEALSDYELWNTAQHQLQQLNEDWQKVNKKDKTDGMSRKAVKAYRRENPGSKLQTAVTTKPSKLKKGSKAAKRRKSFCARMKGMKKAHASAKTKRNPDSPINKALRRWNCESVEQLEKLAMVLEQQVLEKKQSLKEAEKYPEPEQEIIDVTRKARLGREREIAGGEKIDAQLAKQHAERQEYEKSGKFWVKTKQNNYLEGPFTGKQAANQGALSLLKRAPELKGNLLITAWGPDETPVNEAELSEEQLLARELKKQLEMFKHGKDNDLSNKPVDHELGSTPADKEVQKKGDKNK